MSAMIWPPYYNIESGGLHQNHGFLCVVLNTGCRGHGDCNGQGANAEGSGTTQQENARGSHSYMVVHWMSTVWKDINGCPGSVRTGISLGPTAIRLWTINTSAITIEERLA